MSFLRRLRNPKKSIVLAAALFSVCGLVFAAFTAFTSSGTQNPGSSDMPISNNAGNSSSHPWLAGDVAGLSTNHRTSGPQGTAHGPAGQSGGPASGAFSDDSPPPPSGPGNLQGPDYGANPGGANQGGGDLPTSSIFSGEGQNFASAGGWGGSGGGGGAGGAGPGKQHQCESLIGCTSGTPPKDTPEIEGGPKHPDIGNGDPGGFTPTTPVPEPETYAMLLAGLGVMGAIARRRKQRDNSQH